MKNMLVNVATQYLRKKSEKLQNLSFDFSLWLFMLFFYKHTGYRIKFVKKALKPFGQSKKSFGIHRMGARKII